MSGRPVLHIDQLHYRPKHKPNLMKKFTPGQREQLIAAYTEMAIRAHDHAFTFDPDVFAEKKNFVHTVRHAAHVAAEAVNDDLLLIATRPERNLEIVRYSEGPKLSHGHVSFQEHYVFLPVHFPDVNVNLGDKDQKAQLVEAITDAYHHALRPAGTNLEACVRPSSFLSVVTHAMRPANLSQHQTDLYNL